MFFVRGESKLPLGSIIIDIAITNIQVTIRVLSDGANITAPPLEFIEKPISIPVSLFSSVF